MSAIILKKVSTHNLKNIDVRIPHEKLTVVTGLSGSGKSSLAIDTLYAEGQRRYIESLSPYTRQFLERMEKPKIEKAEGILPALCIEAKNVINNARSTVGTHTEVNDFLRVLFARIGKLYCSGCNREVRLDLPDRVFQELMKRHAAQVLIVSFLIPLNESLKGDLSFYLEELQKQGYRRLWLAGKMQTISQEVDFIKQIKKESSLEIVFDRVQLEKSAGSRFAESLERAYERGQGIAAVRVFSSGKLESEVAHYQYSSKYSCPDCRLDFTKPEAHSFSFNSPVGACPACEGFGRQIVLDPDLVIPDSRKSLQEGAIDPWEKPSAAWEKKQLLKFCNRKKIPINVPYRELPVKHQEMLWKGAPKDDYFSIQDFFDYLEKKTYKMHVRIFLSRYRNYQECGICHGSRLKAQALQVKIQESSIYDLQQKTIAQLRHFLENFPVTDHEVKLVGSALEELKNRVRYLDEVGLDYLTLARASRTLSGGEMQRINLATALGTQLVETLYVLDEPSIGLHERDNERLIKILKDLRDLGNTVVVIEHDAAIMAAADYLLDMGPGAGYQGGHVVCEGTFADLKKHPDSFTGKYLRGEERIERQGLFVARNTVVKGKKSSHQITIEGASEHNLKNINVTIPLGQLVVVTGVSGSGKSTLVHDVLYKNYLREKGQPVSEVGAVKKITGFSQIEEILYVDQSPLGKSSRSCPMSYSGIYSAVRELFAGTDQAKRNGMDAGKFSFNTKGGRCEKCEGLGKIKEEMHFLADVYLECEACRGGRFKSEVLEVRWSGKTIREVLDLTVTEAIYFFKAYARIVKPLQLLHDLGLGYLTLGQSTMTFSAGEAQRLKLAIEMLEGGKKQQLFIFDEPTVGLHHHDVKHLLRAFERLLEHGHSLLVVEHHMELIRCADYILDLGPEGGSGGGEVVACGTPEEVARAPRSITGKYLRR